MGYETDILQFCDRVKDKYPMILDNTRVHICPEKVIITNLVTGEDGVSNTMYIDDLTTDDLLLLVECDGSKKSLDIVKDMHNNKGITIEKIKEYMQIVEKYEDIFLEFSEKVFQSTNTFEITGTVEYRVPIYTVLELDAGKIKTSVEKIIGAMKFLNSRGCRCVEIVVEGDSLYARDVKKLVNTIIDEFDYIILRVDNLNIDKNFIWELGDKKDKLFWVLNSKENGKVEFKEEIRFTNLYKRGSRVIIKPKDEYLDGYNVHFMPVDKNDNLEILEKNKLFIRTGGSVYAKHAEEFINLGSLRENNMENILENNLID
ncbi:MAG: hypothetical protein LBN09_02280 [Clostridioides sp.]|nr:hypothetical protein [Clostridioides sp.]